MVITNYKLRFQPSIVTVEQVQNLIPPTIRNPKDRAKVKTEHQEYDNMVYKYILKI